MPPSLAYNVRSQNSDESGLITDDIASMMGISVTQLLYIIIAAISCCICISTMVILFCSFRLSKSRRATRSSPTSTRPQSSDAMDEDEMVEMTSSGSITPQIDQVVDAHPIHITPHSSTASPPVKMQPTAHSGSTSTMSNSKRQSISNFSGVDSQGIDIDDASHVLIPHLYSIPESKESSFYKHSLHRHSVVSGDDGGGFIPEFVAKQQEAYYKVTGTDPDQFLPNPVMPAPSVLSAVTLASVNCRQFETNDMIPNGITLSAEPDHYSSDEDESITQSQWAGNDSIFNRMRLRARQSHRKAPGGGSGKHQYTATPESLGDFMSNDEGMEQ